jgi:hypothetical protein
MHHELSVMYPSAKDFIVTHGRHTTGQPAHFTIMGSVVKATTHSGSARTSLPHSCVETGCLLYFYLKESVSQPSLAVIIVTVTKARAAAIWVGTSHQNHQNQGRQSHIMDIDRPSSISGSGSGTCSGGSGGSVNQPDERRKSARGEKGVDMSLAHTMHSVNMHARLSIALILYKPIRIDTVRFRFDVYRSAS